MESNDTERAIRGEVIVPAGLDEVWNAWTTEDGIRSFFAPDVRVRLEVGGPYEIYFDPQAEPGRRGAEENESEPFPRRLGKGRTVGTGL